MTDQLGGVGGVWGLYAVDIVKPDEGHCHVKSTCIRNDHEIDLGARQRGQTRRRRRMRGSKARRRGRRGTPAPAHSEIKTSLLTKQNRTEKPRDGGQD